MDSNPTDHIPLVDATDLEILVHRDVHFGGSFDEMLQYYENEGVGCSEEINTQQIKKLQKIGESSEYILTDEALHQIEKGKQLYLDLRSLYEKEETPAIQKRIADLILTEKEDPEEETKALIEMGEQAYPALLDLLHSETFYHNYSPGYGRAPALAANVLKKLGNKDCMPHLLSAIGQGSFETDEACIEALLSFGDDAKAFLINKLQNRPISKDNENAALVLSSFPSEPEIAHVCFNLLLDPEAHKHPSLTAYLVFPCDALETQAERIAFEELSKKDFLSSFTKKEMETVIKQWQR